MPQYPYKQYIKCQQPVLLYSTGGVTLADRRAVEERNISGHVIVMAGRTRPTYTKCRELSPRITLFVWLLRLKMKYQFCCIIRALGPCIFSGATIDEHSAQTSPSPENGTCSTACSKCGQLIPHSTHPLVMSQMIRVSYFHHPWCHQPPLERLDCIGSLAWGIHQT